MRKLRTVGLIAATLAVASAFALWWRDVGTPDIDEPRQSRLTGAPPAALPSRPLVETADVERAKTARPDVSASTDVQDTQGPGATLDSRGANGLPNRRSATTSSTADTNLASLELAPAEDDAAAPKAADVTGPASRFRERPVVTASLTSRKSEERVHFALDQYRLEPSALATLEGLVAELSSAEEILKLAVDGHCDDTGTDSYNQALSEMRAEVVVDYLRQRGLRVRHVVSRGFGERVPIAPGRDDATRAQNRRAEIRVDWVERTAVSEVSMELRQGAQRVP